MEVVQLSVLEASSAHAWSPVEALRAVPVVVSSSSFTSGRGVGVGVAWVAAGVGNLSITSSTGRHRKKDIDKIKDLVYKKRAYKKNP